jgi:hypothetical protein
MARKSGSLNNINLQYLLQNYKKKNSKRATTENYLVAPQLRKINNNTSQTPNMNTMIEYLLSNFTQQQLAMKNNQQRSRDNQRKALLKESNGVLTKRLMKESNIAYHKIMGMGPTRGEQLLNIARRPYNNKNNNKNNNNNNNNNKNTNNNNYKSLSNKSNNNDAIIKARVYNPYSNKSNNRDNTNLYNYYNAEPVLRNVTPPAPRNVPQGRRVGTRVRQPVKYLTYGTTGEQMNSMARRNNSRAPYRSRR